MVGGRKVEGRGATEKPVIRRHIRLDESRITTCHLSARRAVTLFSGNSPFGGEKRVTYVSAGSRYANRSIENAHARCLWDSSYVRLAEERNFYIFCLLLRYQAWTHFIRDGI